MSNDKLIQRQYMLTVGLAVVTTIEAKGDPVGTPVGFRGAFDGDRLGFDVGCSDENDANKIETRKVSVCEMTAVKMESIQAQKKCSPPLLATH